MVGRRQVVWRLLTAWEKRLEGKAVADETKQMAMAAVAVVDFMMVLSSFAIEGRLQFGLYQFS